MATNKAWVLGNDYFKDSIEQQINRQAKPKDKGGSKIEKVSRTKSNQ
jgi:putative transposase